MLGSILGSYGAEVIKVESKRRLDGMRFGKVFELGEELEKNSFFQNRAAYSTGCSALPSWASITPTSLVKCWAYQGKRYKD